METENRQVTQGKHIRTSDELVFYIYRPLRPGELFVSSALPCRQRDSQASRLSARRMKLVAREISPEQMSTCSHLVYMHDEWQWQWGSRQTELT